MTDYAFFPRGGQVEEGDGLKGGSQHLPPTITVSYTFPYPRRAVFPYQPPGLGREAENLPQHCLPVSTSWGEGYRGQEIWSINHMGKPLSGQGPLHGGSGWESNHLGLQWTQLALCLGAVTQGHQPCTTPQGGALRHPASKRGWDDCLQGNQPAGSLPTPHLQPAGCLPNTVEWTWRTHHNLSTRVPGQWCKPNWRQVHLSQNWHPTIPGRGARLKGTTYWWALYHHNSQPHKTTPQNPKERSAWPWE